eukprot:c9407_g1_i1 orf=2-226(+)
MFYSPSSGMGPVLNASVVHKKVLAFSLVGKGHFSLWFSHSIQHQSFCRGGTTYLSKVQLGAGGCRYSGPAALSP